MVLVEKALTMQADLDLDGWMDMMSEDVVYSFPDDGEHNQTMLIGKFASKRIECPYRKGIRLEVFSLIGNRTKLNHCFWYESEKIGCFVSRNFEQNEKRNKTHD